MVLGEVTWLLCLGLIPSVLQEPPRDQRQGNETSGEEWQLRLSRDLVITQMPRTQHHPGQPATAQGPSCLHKAVACSLPVMAPWHIYCHPHLTDEKMVAERMLVT